MNIPSKAGSTRSPFGGAARLLPLLAALLPSHDNYESVCRKGQRDQALYAEGLGRVSRDEERKG